MMGLKSLLGKLTGRTDRFATRLVTAFPNELEDDVRSVVSVLPIFRHQVLRSDGQVHYVDDRIHTCEYVVTHNSAIIRIPSRLYFDELNPRTFETLTDRQKAIVNCIYTRHHVGFVRQKNLEGLSKTSFEFVRPFVVQLLGEYVIEILYVVDQMIDAEAVDSYASYLKENHDYWKQTQSRVVSYWNEYYRKAFPLLDDYVGKQIVNRLNKALADNK